MLLIMLLNKKEGKQVQILIEYSEFIHLQKQRWLYLLQFELLLEILPSIKEKNPRAFTGSSNCYVK